MATASSATPNTLVTSLTPNPTAPAADDDVTWIATYLAIHETSRPSYRYSYILWLAILLVFVLFAILHWTGSRGGAIGAYWSKWSLRRRTWRKKHSLAVARRTGQPHKQPLSFPSNAQLLSLFILIIASFALCTVGPDYINPTSHTWSIKNAVTTPAFETPQYTIAKAWWTAGNRTGIIAFALFPLCVLFALKAPPFALFALPFMIQIYFDKLVRLHRWSGRLIWLITTAHVVTWIVQLSRDRRVDTGKIALSYVLVYQKFIFGMIGYILLTLLTLLSISPIRTRHYEIFYYTHVILVAGTIVFSALHHPPVWWWCWAALGLWMGERIWRGTMWLYVNGMFGGVSDANVPANVTPYITITEDKSKSKQKEKEVYEFAGVMSPTTPGSAVSTASASSSTPLVPLPHPHRASQQLTRPNYPPSPSTPRPSSPNTLQSSSLNYLPPPGYAHAVLLPGRTVRLRLITPGVSTWAPGQHYLINIPAVSKFTTHPFTVASVCDEQWPTDEGREITLLVRARKGWTKRLWDHVSDMISKRQPVDEGAKLPRAYPLPTRGVLLRALVDGPFGSSVRARWGAYSTAVIVVGGSGVSFGLSIMEYLCLCLAGRDGKSLGGHPGGFGQSGFSLKRVRFIWLVREFAHIQWCASALRRCTTLIPPNALEISIFVTNARPMTREISMAETATSEDLHDPLAPPQPGYAKRRRSFSSRTDESDEDAYVDLSYYFEGDEAGDQVREGELGHEEHILDYTNFDGDDDTALPGEGALSNTLRKQGRLRRAKTRRVSRALEAKTELDRAVEQQRKANRRSSLYSNEPLLASPSKRMSALSEVSHYSSPPSSPTSSSTPLPPLPPVPPIPPPPETSFGAERRKSFPHPLSITTSTLFPQPSTEALTPSSSKAPSVWSHHDSESTRGFLTESAQKDGIHLDIDPQEAHDLTVVCESARPGKPRLDRILADEVERSKGAIVVACCGPQSLNALMRKSVAAQINPERLRRGDKRGSIAFVSEEFEY